MMSTGFRNGVIRLDEAAAVFYSGQVLSGAVCFNLDQPLTFSVLYIKYNGEANVFWEEQETEVVNDMEREYTVEYVGHEDYFNFTENLIGGSGTSQLPAGSHAIPFQYEIPSISPSSFEGSKGKISYKITAVMLNLSPLSTQEELCKEFQVVAPYDLNLGEPYIKQPINIEFEEMYGCDCFCSQDPVTVRVQLPASGYCPGQVIPIAVEVQNDSSVEITKMKFEILTKECYRSKQPVAEFIPPEEVLSCTKKGAVMSKSKGNFTCDLPVPKMIVPHLQNCTIIDIRYFLRVTVKMSGCNDEMQDESEIYLGLVPLKDTTEGEYIHPLAHNLPSGPIPVLDDSPIVRSQGFTEDAINTGLKQFNALQSGPYPGYPPSYPSNNPPAYPSNNPLLYPSNNPPSYPSNNSPYPPQNNFETPSPQKPAPYRDYEIGFKAPERLSDSNPSYPDVNMISPNPPYPTANLMPSALPPYPTANLMPQMHVSYSNGSASPSAPPPSS